MNKKELLKNKKEFYGSLINLYFDIVYINTNYKILEITHISGRFIDNHFTKQNEISFALLEAILKSNKYNDEANALLGICYCEKECNYFSYLKAYECFMNIKKTDFTNNVDISQLLIWLEKIINYFSKEEYINVDSNKVNDLKALKLKLENAKE